MNRVESTTETQVSSRAILFNPPSEISLASLDLDSGDWVASTGSDCSISSSDVSAKVSANADVKVSAT